MSAVSPASAIGHSPAIEPANRPVVDRAKETDGPGLFQEFLRSTNLDQQASNQAVEDLVAGKTDNVQEVVIAVAKAEMSFQLFMEIRNHLIDSYNELMRMQF